MLWSIYTFGYLGVHGALNAMELQGDNREC